MLKTLPIHLIDEISFFEKMDIYKVVMLLYIIERGPLTAEFIMEWLWERLEKIIQLFDSSCKY